MRYWDTGRNTTDIFTTTSLLREYRSSEQTAAPIPEKEMEGAVAVGPMHLEMTAPNMVAAMPAHMANHNRSILLAKTIGNTAAERRATLVSPKLVKHDQSNLTSQLEDAQSHVQQNRRETERKCR